jgi:teichuronic acid biosynthesis glycosyltransferase TuaH
MKRMGMASTITILSTADFDSQVWTNKQHLAMGLSKSYEVFYIDSLGLRMPTFSGADMHRMAARLAGRVGNKSSSPARSRTESSASITVIAPVSIPLHGVRAIRALNRKIIQDQVLSMIPRERRDILWTFSPVTYGLEDSFRRTVYHSVDLLHTVPRVPSRTILRAEDILLRKADAVVASSTGVADHLVKRGRRDSILWENVADTRLYEENAVTEPLSRAIFSGNLTPVKIDFRLLQSIADGGTKLVLAGPVSIDGIAGRGQLDNLIQHRNVEYLGLLKPSELAVEVGKSMVGLIPYNVNDHTSGVFPMKVYEYLSSGLAVIATPLKSLCETTPINGLTIAPRDIFATSVANAMRTYTKEEAVRRRDGARSHSWESRFDQARMLIEQLE